MEESQIYFRLKSLAITGSFEFRNRLQSYGWEVSQEPLATQELLVPVKFDESDDYLALQTEQGFDLSKYAGKRVKRYTYEVLNYPTGETGVQADLLIYNNVVIGGEVLSPRLDGFLHGLSLPGQKAPSATESGFPVLPVIICIVAMGAIVAVLVLKKKKPAAEAVHVSPTQTEPPRPATPPEHSQAVPAAKAASPASGPRSCPSCGKPLTPGVKFCQGCGKPLGGGEG